MTYVLPSPKKIKLKLAAAQRAADDYNGAGIENYYKGHLDFDYTDELTGHLEHRQPCPYCRLRRARRWAINQVNLRHMALANITPTMSADTRARAIEECETALAEAELDDMSDFDCELRVYSLRGDLARLREVPHEQYKQ
jgi:hypothetical protein